MSDAVSTPNARPAGRPRAAFDPEELYTSPNALAAHYSRFRVAERMLLTGHSHQAWPDPAFEGQVEAWEDAALHVDEKWERAFARAERVRQGYRRLIGDPNGAITLSASTHDLVVRWLSALPLGERARLVTTTGEFHTLRRQLARLEEEGVEVVRVDARPAGSVGDRLVQAVDERTAAALVSSVFFEDAHIAGGLDRAMAACERVGAELLVDAYHHLNVVPFSIGDSGLDRAFVAGGGYKYCQLGEGNAFLRAPPGCRMRPVATGWFAEFGLVLRTEAGKISEERVAYPDGSGRFAGATYDPVSHYRAAAVFDFFDATGLDPAFLREVSQHQVGLLAERFDALDLDPERIDRDRTVGLERLGGFLALRSPEAPVLRRALLERGVHTDCRDDILRLGPAPYLSDRQLVEAIEALGDVVRTRS